LATAGYIEKDFQALKDVADNSMKTIFRAYELYKSNQVVGVSTGFTDLDAKLGGFQNSDLIILAGRPGMGKTAFAINLAISAAEKFFQSKASSANAASKSVGIFSLEMSAEQLATRMISMETSINSLALRSGNFRHEQHMNISSAAIHLGKLPFYIDDTAGITISAIRTRARKMYRQHNLGMIVIDYLQLIQSAGTAENRVLEVSEITKSLKILARELNIPIIAIADSNSNPDNITHIIPGNDDAIKAITLYCQAFADSALSGLEEAVVNSGADLGESVVNQEGKFKDSRKVSKIKQSKKVNKFDANSVDKTVEADFEKVLQKS
jgi:replicative DNA helicase